MNVRGERWEMRIVGAGRDMIAPFLCLQDMRNDVMLS